MPDLKQMATPAAIAEASKYTQSAAQLKKVFTKVVDTMAGKVRADPEIPPKHPLIRRALPHSIASDVV